MGKTRQKVYSGQADVVFSRQLEDGGQVADKLLKLRSENRNSLKKLVSRAA